MAFEMNQYGGITLPPGFNELPPGAQRRALEYAMRRLREGNAEEEEPTEAQPSPEPEPEPALPPRRARKGAVSEETRATRKLITLCAVVYGIIIAFFGYKYVDWLLEQRFWAREDARLQAAAIASAPQPQPVQPAPSPPPQPQQPKPVKLGLTWIAADLLQGQKMQLEARVQYSNGDIRDVTREAEWASDNPSIASVSSEGMVTAVSPGRAVISATYRAGGFSETQSATVTVLPLLAKSPAEADWDELAKRVAPYVFRIQSNDGGSIGTAFYTGDNWRAVKEAEKTGWAGSGSSITWIYTAAHLVQGRENCKFEFQRVWKGKVDYEWADGPGVKERVNPDFTELPTKWDGRGFLEHSPEEYFENAPLFGNAYDLLQGETVLIVGNPRNLWQMNPTAPGPLSTLGRVLAVDVSARIDDGSLLGTLHRHLLKIQADTDPGSSGSPVFNSKGEVVGMVIAETTEREPGTDLTRHVCMAVMFPLRK